MTAKEYLQQYGYAIRRTHAISDHLAELRAVCEQLRRWIPCSERMPEPLQDVLVCTDIGTVTLAWLNGDSWFFADNGYCYGIKSYGLNEVTHWMPLPEPPEKE